MSGDVRSDLRYAARALRRQPAFVAGVTLTFALAIGANATMFGLVSRLMLSPPPGIRDAAQVARVGFRHVTDDGSEFVMNTTSYPAFRAVASVRNAFDGVAASKVDTLTAGQGTAVSRVATLGVSSDYFQVLGASTILGRVINAGDDALPTGSRVVVLSHAYWQMAFAGDRGAIGRDILLDDKPYTVVGVSPPGFNGDGQAAVSLFMPLSALLADRGGDWITSHGMNIVSVVVRLRAGVTAAGASTVARSAMVAESAAAGVSDAPSLDLESVVPGREARDSPQARIALWLSAVSLVVLLVAVANVGTQ
jgi:hypothetical protein